MKFKSWILAGLVFIGSSSLGGAYILSRRAFLQDFNTGVHAYLAGNYGAAEQRLTDALRRRPKNVQTKKLLIKVLVERSFAQYHQKDFTGALATLDRATALTPEDDESRQLLAALREQLAVAPEKRPVNMEQILDGLYCRLPERDQPNSMQSLMEQWLKRSQKNQEDLLHRFWDNQERWLVQLEKEKGNFRKILYGGIGLFSLGGVILVVLLAGVLHTYLGRRGIFSRLLEDHYQRLLSVLPAGTQILLGPPVSLHQIPEAHQMDVIEAEIISGTPPEESHRQLASLMGGANPWVQARAATILHRLNPAAAMKELKRLVVDASPEMQIPGIWALAEVATTQSINLLAPLAYSPVREIQQGVIRSLLQLQARKDLPSDVQERIGQALSEIRTKTGWIF